MPRLGTRQPLVLTPDLGEEGLPSLPDIQSEDIRKQVFTHRSLWARPTQIFEDLPEDPAPDNEILEHQGDSVLLLVITDLLRELYPCLRVGPSTKIRALVVNNATLASISLQYKLPDRMHLHASQSITLRASMHVRADLFEAYVGGLYIDQGMAVVKSWLNVLFRPYLKEGYRIVREQHSLLTPPPSPQSEPESDETLPAPQSISRRTLNLPTIGHLALFNQYVSQQKSPVEWVYGSAEGSKTTPIWIATAWMGGKSLGTGRGRTKKAARDVAAKHGLEKMGVDIPQS